MQQLVWCICLHPIFSRLKIQIILSSQISTKEILRLLSHYLAPRLERIIGGGVRSTYSRNQNLELADFNLFVHHSAPVATQRSHFDTHNLVDVPDAEENAALGAAGEARQLLPVEGAIFKELLICSCSFAKLESQRIYRLWQIF